MAKKTSKRPKVWLARGDDGEYDVFIDTKSPVKHGGYWCYGTKKGVRRSVSPQQAESVIPKTGPRAKYRLVKGGGPVEVKLA